MSKQSTVLLIGGSDAGKSNFLFRFWLAIREKSNPLLLPDGAPPIAEYLNRGAAKLLAGDFEMHTPRGTFENCEIPVLARGEKAVVVVPDRPGEEWSRIYKERRIPSDWLGRLSADTTCLVLVRAHSDANQAPLDWISVQHFHGNEGNLMGPARQDLSTPTQVVLVDWIQIISRILRSGPASVERPKIGVVISAWDLLAEDEKLAGPRKYLRDQYPLLGDFLESNLEKLEVEVFGISLFGGDPKCSASFKDACLDSNNPCGGGYVVHQIGGHAQRVFDLTFPIAWALGLENGQ
jgi:hypothetical protein